MEALIFFFGFMTLGVLGLLAWNVRNEFEKIDAEFDGLNKKIETILEWFDHS